MAQTSFSEKALSGAVARLQGLEREIQMAGAYADSLQDLLTACLSLRAATVGGKASAVADALALVVPGAVALSLTKLNARRQHWNRTKAQPNQPRIQSNATTRVLLSFAVRTQHFVPVELAMCLWAAMYIC